MTIDVVARKGPWAAAAAHPVLVAGSALFIFACLLAASYLFNAAERMAATIEITQIELDREADGPATLIRTAPLVVDAERDAILSDRLIKDAMETVSLDADMTDVLAAGSPLQQLAAWFSAPTSDDGRSADTVVATKTLRSNLTVDAGLENDQIQISLPSRTDGGNDDVRNLVNAIAAAYVDLRNRDRKRKKAEALSWADKKLADWQATVDRAGPEVESNQAGSAELDALAEEQSRHLINLLLDATMAAQASTLTEMKNALNADGETSPRRDIDVLEKENAQLELELERLALVSLETGQAPAEEVTPPQDVKASEEGPALFRKDLDALISSGFLDSPAATILSPATRVPHQSLSNWMVIVPLAAAISLLIALVLAMIVERVQRGTSNEPNAHDADATSVLSNPHWPMTPEQHRQINAAPIELGQSQTSNS